MRSAGEKFNDFMVTNTIVSSDGTVLWLYPALDKTSCSACIKDVLVLVLTLMLLILVLVR